MDEADRNLIIALAAQGFSTAKIRQRIPLLNLKHEPRFSIAEIDAVVQPQPQPQPQQQLAAMHRPSLQFDTVLGEMVNDLALLSGSDYQPHQRRAVLLGMLHEIRVDLSQGFPPVTDPGKILAVF